MALIAQCFYCTEDNGKLKCAQQCLNSLVETVDLTKHTLIVIDQNSSEEATKWLQEFDSANDGNRIIILYLPQNIGTARGINLAIRQRSPNEVVIKCDDDLLWHSAGWVEEMESALADHPHIGILGLKRDDVYGEFVQEGNILYSHDIMGTCTALSPALLDKVGYFRQFSNYGFDDNILSARSLAAGFKNAYLPHIKITHLDEGGTPYTEWKKREANMYLQEASYYMDKIKKGELTYYYDGND